MRAGIRVGEEDKDGGETKRSTLAPSGETKRSTMTPCGETKRSTLAPSGVKLGLQS